MPPRSVEATVPLIYRHVLTTVEPTLTLLGVLFTIGSPATYIEAIGGSTEYWDPHLHFLYTQLCGAWLALAFNGAVVLRLVDDRRTWTLICGGMLLSDLIFTISCAEGMGGWANFVQTARWRPMDWLVFFTSAPLAVVRVCFLMKIGFRPDPVTTHEQQRKKQ